MKKSQELKYSPYSMNLVGEIKEQTVDTVIKFMRKNDAEWEEKGIPTSERKHIFHTIGPGGDVTAGLAIYDLWKTEEVPVVTIAVGLVASMDALLLSSGTKGYRYAYPNAEFMIHQPLGGASGQASDIEIVANRIKSKKHQLNKILAENTGKPIEIIEKDTDRDFYLTAEEALEYGLIDEILY